jgi:hypothetical protein
MARAIATAMGNSALEDYVTLIFTEVEIRRSQQRGVLVDVGLRDYQGSTAAFTSSLTESNINTQMLSLGLRPVQSVLVKSGSPGSPLTTSTIENKTSSVPEIVGSTNLNITVIAAAACAVGAFASIAGCLYWRRRRSGKSKPLNVSFTVLFSPKRACIYVRPRESEFLEL